jgi:purine-binding chemotaxis protein CheW
MEMARRKLLIGARFLSFTLDNEAYCMEILKVKELMGMTSITPLPQTPDFIRGVINLRGQIIPIVDLRVKFGLPFKDYTKRTSIIVVEVDYQGEVMLMGLVVDAIEEVVSIPEDKISRIPYINAKVRAEYIKGIANTSEGIKIILDVVRVLSDEELATLKKTEIQAEAESNANKEYVR